MPDRLQMMKRQQVLADFGDFALRSDRLDEVLTEACRLVAEALDIHRAKVLEIEEGGQRLLMRAGIGWEPGTVGQLRIPMDERSSESFSIQAGRPVVSRDIRKEDRFDIPAFMKKAGVVAMANVPIFVPGGRAYGLLQVDATEPRNFSKEDTHFLRTYATILGPVIDRLLKVQTLSVTSARADAARRESETRGRLLQAVWEADASGVVAADSPSWRAFTGQTLEEWLGYGWLDAIHPEDRSYAQQQWQEAVVARSPVNAEFRLRVPGSGWHWTNVRAAPVLDAQGHIEKWVGLNLDIDARKRAEVRLRESEELYRIALDGGAMGAWRWDTRDGMVRADDAFQALWGLSFGDQAHPFTVYIDRMDPDGAASLHAVRAKEINPGEQFHDQVRVTRGPTSGRWIQWRGRADRDKPWIINGVSFDITEQKLADQKLRASEERLQVLVAELQHRTRNLMGIVRSMADRTLRRSTSLDDFTPAFKDRLLALARVQGLLSRMNTWERITFDELIRTELMALDAESERVVLDGPANVMLRSSTVQTFSMALHELATNALKYGALKQEAGRLLISWQLEISGEGGVPWLHVDWRECGVAMPPEGAPAQGGGLGRELIERALPHQLGARTTYVMEPNGVHCTISLPVSERTKAEAPKIGVDGSAGRALL
ncbi:PAS domain-containing protein [Mesorhizobium sp. RP14(2022)]|uniref:Blue-light-activated histidine kinase n=1 Tax=Mesorhizobium liriopis TaxID=2953882 RepID=A0ABT1CAB6_9HYPH|nr:HWE histidine kinase domain-containing protein [Mesorhizobium liriopis]MCO6051727.1 PAS domain-containing protein [Mesorhizobium liriopis]